MPGASKKILPPKPGSRGNGQVHKVPSGPSPSVRENFKKQVDKTIKKNPPK